MREAVILVGDIGGTNARFALAHAGPDGVVITNVWKRPGADFPTFDDAIAAYLATATQRIDGASFGFAGPVRGDRVELLHRDWTIDRAAQRSQLDVERVVMVNDFMAMARSAPELAPSDTEVISQGQADPQGNIAVGGPGTGFGFGVLRRLTGAPGWVVVGGEGGHRTFAPQTDLEWAVFELMDAEHGYVSAEMVASGSGFDITLAALADAMDIEPRNLTEQDILALAERGDELALEFCRLRARTVMTALGDTALFSNATGGVFIAGGISTRIERYLKEREALDRFYSRGARTELVSRIPIRLITTELAPLIGAAHLWLDEEARGWL
jgi:glucokinase